MNTIYNILEVANTHAGDINYLKSLIQEYEDVKDAHALKLQILHPDHIALPDYAWYSVYQEICFKPEQWKEIIELATKTKDVWLDMFDAYAIQILKENKHKIIGLKFQASILFNKALFEELSKVDLSDKKIIINISGIEQNKIANYISDVEQLLKPAELILQIGFQSYPTKLHDSGIVKIKTLLTQFNKRISFADHIDGSDQNSLIIPVLAAMEGASIIEKHIMLSGPKAKYDYASSVDKERYLKYLSLLTDYLKINEQPFLNEAEKKYLTASIQIPILNKTKMAGSLISLKNDLSFRRTNQKGIRTDEVTKLANEYYILATDKKENDVLHLEDFKKANIATIIACRLKSTRLPKKATAKIGNLSSVELCIKNALKFRNINHTILATSNLDEDADLVNYTYSPQVIFHKGHPDDVIKRYLDIIHTLKIDVLVRVTADMQYVSDDILQILLKSHFETGADYTSATEAAIGTNLEIINTQALRYVKSFFPNANYSEYMTWYLKNNPEHFKLNIVNLPQELVRNYRLTLDYQEDFDLFVKIEEHFAKNNLEYSITELFKFLDENPEIANINKDLIVKYRTDQTLINTLNRETKIPNIGNN